MDAHYIDIKPFSEGLALVRHSKKRRYGYIDLAGKEVINTQYEEALSFTEGMAFVRDDTSGYFIDKQGTIVLRKVKNEPFNPLNFYAARSFSEGKAAVYSYRDKFGGMIGGMIIDKTGRRVIEMTASRNPLGQFSYGRVLTESPLRERMFLDSLGYPINITGVPTQGYTYGVAAVAINAPPPSDEQPIVDRNNNTTRSRGANSWGLGRRAPGTNTSLPVYYTLALVDVAGLQISTSYYKSISSWNKGIAKVTVAGLYGIADGQGNVILDALYPSIKLENGLLRVERGGDIGYLDTQGGWIWPKEGN